MPNREPELYKDKIEVSLDGRQIFYLFFGGAMIAGLVFVLGVMVGRRVEARGHLDRAQTTAATDPLAALDRLEGGGSLSFHGALTGQDAPSDVEKTIAEMAKKPAPVAAPAPAPAPAPEPPPPAAKPVEEKKTRYTLQLSSFQDKSEADALRASMKSAGYEAYITEAEVSGKGTFYRVRVGSYKSMDAANDAKDAMSKSAKKSATVMKL